MYSEEYERAKKDFINCLVFGIVGMGVPFVIACKEWWPKMQREKQKALGGGSERGKDSSNRNKK